MDTTPIESSELESNSPIKGDDSVDEKPSDETDPQPVDENPQTSVDSTQVLEAPDSESFHPMLVHVRFKIYEGLKHEALTKKICFTVVQ